MARQQLIKLRKGSAAPTAGDFVEAEPAWDSTNGKLYVKNAAGAMKEIGGVVGSSATGLRNITTSTSDPTGGSDGDIWIKYTA
jgi:hypothetical protein